jgi:DNA gyrase subunit A
MRLSKLTGLEREKLAVEYGELCDTIARLEAILGSEAAAGVIVDELRRCARALRRPAPHRDRGGRGRPEHRGPHPRRRRGRHLSHKGYIKRVPLSEYRAQGRGGKGLRPWTRATRTS